MTTALTCTAVDAGYHAGHPVARQVDLSLEAGSVLALLGPNGAGKTTLMLTLAGLLCPLGGRVEVDGRELRPGSPRAAVRAGVVLVPDDRALFKELTVVENLRLASRRGSPTTLDTIFGYFPELGRRAKVGAGSLSGGEQQMLAIGRALMQDPRVLLVDELSMGLAPVIVESLLPVIRRVAHDTGAACVLVEQHVSLALRVADTALVLSHGDVALRGDARELAADESRIEEAYLGRRSDDGGLSVAVTTASR
ncbi:MAG: ABC transporter ATP-binding protein [Nocardioides sp.]|uniref:ABC transporter ATP-binding protein n=1 Tax=Nocardioides sp. TaxID=35761 RepID=UPI0039E2C892